MKMIRTIPNNSALRLLYFQFGGVHPRTIKNLPNGTFDIDELKSKIRDEDQHFPRTRLVRAQRTISKSQFNKFAILQVCIENTHNYLGGRALPVGFIKEVCKSINYTLRFAEHKSR